MPRSDPFQSTLPGWGATARVSGRFPECRNFNPRSPDGERQRQHEQDDADDCISIHAPRMGSDPLHATPKHVRQLISIHAPRMGSDVRRHRIAAQAEEISIHAPRMGSDRGRRSRRSGCADFNPRSPDGERLRHMYGLASTRIISIHAPRMGSDPRNSSTANSWIYFNPRSPDGERRCICGMPIDYTLFQSTLPGWGATRTRTNPLRRAKNFNPRSPDGERPVRVVAQPVRNLISIHAPRMGSDGFTRDGYEFVE